MTPTLDELLDSGLIRLTQMQYDFFHHPEGDFAVAIYGVPDPDRLYIAGPERPGTIYQLAQPGEPADDRGLAACVLPVLVEGLDQAEAVSTAISDMGEEATEFMLPALWVKPLGSSWMFHWHEEEYPFPIAPWDLWPIPSDEQHLWKGVAEQSFEGSKLHSYYDLLNLYNGGEDYLPDEFAHNQDLIRLRQVEFYRIQSEPEPDPDRLQELKEQIEDLKTLNDAIETDRIVGLEDDIKHPNTGEPDPQMPPPVLPPDEAAIWSSLQVLSWRNWLRLSKADWTESSCPDRRRFIEANRSLCPWY